MPKQQTSRSSTIQVRVGEKTKAEVQRYAAAREMTPSEFVRYCIWIYMENTPENTDDY